MSIQLEVGKYYVNRKGSIHKIVTKQGKMFISERGIPFYESGWVDATSSRIPMLPPLDTDWHPYDLVKEVTNQREG